MKNKLSYLGISVLLLSTGFVAGSFVPAEAQLAVSKVEPEALQSEVIDVEDDTQDTVKITKAEYVEEVTEYTREYLETEIVTWTGLASEATAKVAELQALLNQLP